MRAKDSLEKEEIKIRYATALYLALKDSRFESVRQVAVEGGMEPAHLQRIFTGKVDVSFTTNLSVLEAIGISGSQFFAYYEIVTTKNIREFKKYLEEQRKTKGKRNN